jgi:hypothetical protein
MNWVLLTMVSAGITTWIAGMMNCIWPQKHNRKVEIKQQKLQL